MCTSALIGEGTERGEKTFLAFSIVVPTGVEISPQLPPWMRPFIGPNKFETVQWNHSLVSEHCLQKIRYLH